MERDIHIVAVEIGTHKIIAIAGCKHTDGSISITAVEHEKSNNSIKRGCLQNIEEAASHINKVIAKLANRIPDMVIERVYVGIAGQSLHTTPHSVLRQLAIESPITEDIIKNLLLEGAKYSTEETEVLNIIPTKYLIDKCQEKNPIGVIGKEIEAKLQLVTARTLLKNRLKFCFDQKVKRPIAGFITTPLATAAALLTEEEKMLGCALVDFGASTTTLSVYKDGMLCYLVTIPLGGKNITNDLCSLNLLEETAEALKKRFGIACSEYTQEQFDTPVEGIESTVIKHQTLFQVIGARLEEIVANVVAQLAESKYAQLLPKGMVITGGASNILGLEELLAEKTGMSVRQGVVVKDITFDTESDLYTNNITAAIGLVLIGTENCLREKEAIAPESEEELPPPNNNKKPKKEPRQSSGGGFGSLFTAMEEKLGGLGKKVGDYFDENE